MATGRTVEQKASDWYEAYRLVAEQLTPPALREQLNAVINQPFPISEDMDALLLYNSRVSASMAMARLVSANDRAAATVAALITQTGIKPAGIDYGDDT